jgi:hypothetical protein
MGTSNFNGYMIALPPAASSKDGFKQGLSEWRNTNSGQTGAAIQSKNVSLRAQPSGRQRGWPTEDEGNLRKSKQTN